MRATDNMALRAPGVLVLLLALAQPARAEPPPDDEDRYETLVTSESSDPGEGSSIQRVDRADIERSGSHSVAEVLELQPSIHATTGSRGERIFSLRGFEQRQVVVLIDGTPAYIPYDGQVDLDLVPAPLVDHITVIKGPGSVLYGPGGMGGAVNIVTRRPGRGPLLETRLGMGRGDAYELQGYHTHRFGRLSYALHGSLTHRDGLPLSARFEPAPGENGVLRANSDRHVYHLGGRVGLELAPRHDLEAGVTYVDGQRGVPPSTLESVAQFWRFSAWRGLNVSAGHRGRYLSGGSLELDEQVYATLFDNLLDSYDDASFSTQLTPRAFHSWYHDRIYGGRIRARYRTDRLPWGLTAFRLWAGAQHERHHKELAGDSRSHRSRSIVTLAPEAELFLGERWRLLAAFQVDVELPDPDEGLERNVGPGPLVSLRFDPTERLLLRATFARRHRFPSLKERFTENTTGLWAPNPGLRPESAWHAGLEGEWRPRPWLTARAALFDAEVERLIERVHLGSGLSQLQNVGDARLLGAELSLQLRPWRWLGLGAGYGWLHARRTDGDDDRLEYRPAHKVVLSALLAPWSWLELSSRLRVVGPQRFVHPDTRRWGTLGAYPVLDARVVVRPRTWLDVYLSGRNLLDANFQTQYGFPDPGLQLWVGMGLRTPG